MIPSLLLFLLASALAALSWRSFRQKGYLLNNAWIFASEEERERMDKAPYYRQSAVVFLLLSLVFALIGLYALTERPLWLWLEGAAAAAALVYAVVSSARIPKNPKR